MNTIFLSEVDAESTCTYIHSWYCVFTDHFIETNRVGLPQNRIYVFIANITEKFRPLSMTTSIRPMISRMESNNNTSYFLKLSSKVTGPHYVRIFQKMLPGVLFISDLPCLPPLFPLSPQGTHSI